MKMNIKIINNSDIIEKIISKWELPKEKNENHQKHVTFERFATQAHYLNYSGNILLSFLYIFSRFMFCDYYRNRVVHIANNKHISLLAMENLLTI